MNARYLVGVGTLLLSFTVAQARGGGDALLSARLQPSALLSIDQNRATVIDRIVTQWGEPLAQSDAALSADQLRTLLSGLRADHLLAASLAGNLDGLRNAISTAVTSTAVVSPSLLHTKALGDTNDDLVYTPINPCRIVDTRLGAGGFLGNDTERDWKVSRPGGNFTDQGGSSSDCAIPANPAAVLANFAVTGSSQPGVLFAWAFNQPAPTASTLNYAGGQTIANAVIVPLAQGQAEDLSVFVSTGTNVVVDVVGYFKPPGAPIGTVSNIATGTGLTGGPITSTGTIGLASTQLLPSTACASNQFPQWNGNAWTCATVSGGGGTVTSVATGTGLTGGPITTSGTINLASTQLMPSVACATNQIPKWNGSAWACGSDNDTNSGGTVTSITAGSGLSGGTITTSGTIAVDPTSSTLTGNFFAQGGNTFGTIAALGTLDNWPLDIFVNNALSWQLRPDAAGISPVVVGGYGSPINGNSVIGGASGAVISGGGAAGVTLLGEDCNRPCRNRVTDAFGTIGGGAANIAGDDAGTATDHYFATVAGGLSNWALGAFSSVGGGTNNAVSNAYGTVPGGGFNTADYFATVGGGWGNHANNSYATVAGGADNTASGNSATVAGGGSNTASGNSATVGGGSFNTAAGDYSFAAGYQATIPASAPGTFFWNDSTGAQSLPPNAHDEFIVIATNGIGLYTYKDLSHGCALVGTAGSWACTSDRATKADFTAIDPRDVLAHLVAMPITQWRWKGEAETVRHMGPMAQDFRSAFGLGYDDKTITLVDSDGVALAAIQGLNQVVQEKDARIAELEQEMTDVRGELAALKAAMAELVASKIIVTQVSR